MKNFISGVKDVAKTSIWTTHLFFYASPKLSVLYFCGETIRPIFGIISAYIFAYAIDQTIALVSSGSNDIKDFLPTLFLLLGFDILNRVFNVSTSFSRRIIYRKLDYSVRRQLQEHLRLLGVAKLETPEIANKAQRFSEQIPAIQEHMGMSLGVLASIVGIFGSFIFVISTIPQIVPLFILVTAISAFIDQKGIRSLWILDRETTEKRRSFWFTASRLADPNDLKELLLTGGYKLLRQKYDDFVKYIMGETIAIRKKWLWKIMAVDLLQTIAMGIGFLALLQKTLLGLISIGDLTFQFRMLTTFSGSMDDLFNNFVNLRESAFKLVDSRELFESHAPEIDGDVVLRHPHEPSEIIFANASFRYANASKDALTNINLQIKPGEKIAIVGENGAGKTTLVKLITRLYKASTGEILIDKVNINNVKARSWYRKLGVLFQDYNVYSNLTLGENVSIGDVRKKYNKERINKALEKANAKEFTSLYENGLDQILNERFKGGTRPSTGQWQKIAIARFFYRNAPILILDEPTASIDAVAEAEIFDNIYKFIRNKTVIIISHRFSTVRNADRILVLDKGRIVEEGSHEELLKMKGKYANAFKLQAQGYK